MWQKYRELDTNSLRLNSSIVLAIRFSTGWSLTLPLGSRMFRGLTNSNCIAAAFAVTLSGFTIGLAPAKSADLGGDCCADLEERVADLEITTIRKGNKKVSVTISGWIFKVGSWWDDGHEGALYWGDGDTTLSSHFNVRRPGDARTRLDRRLHCAD